MRKGTGQTGTLATEEEIVSLDDGLSGGRDVVMLGCWDVGML